MNHIRFLFFFDTEDHISHVFGGKDSTDAFWAMEEFAQEAISKNTSIRKYASTYFNTYNPVFESVCVSYSRSYLNNLRNQ